MIDSEVYTLIMDSVRESQTAIYNQDFQSATALYFNLVNIVVTYSGVNFYNILTKNAGSPLEGKRKGTKVQVILRLIQNGLLVPYVTPQYF